MRRVEEHELSNISPVRYLGMKFGQVRMHGPLEAGAGDTQSA